MVRDPGSGACPVTVTTESIALTGVYKNMSRGIVALFFKCRPVSGELTTNPEVKAFRWLAVLHAHLGL
jgi:hypothetical protein